MTRSHYTLSADAMRMATRDPGGPLIQSMPSRAEMASVRSLIAEALGMEDASLSEAIANFVTNKRE